ncbi:MAG: hypothetical protein LBE78_10675 [Burkholderiaceae bacterium]|jgi:hypothetical protein|nr:hypothetical protein [Burkholderiaceae bacterium]
MTNTKRGHEQNHSLHQGQALGSALDELRSTKTNPKGIVRMTPDRVLKSIRRQSAAPLNRSVIADPVIRDQVNRVYRCTGSRACVRLTMRSE